MNLTSHFQLFFRPHRRILTFPWRSLECGTAFPKADERCIYFYSTVPDCGGHALAPFYAGQRRHAHLLASSLSLRHYKRWWSEYANRIVRCDVFLIGDRHFNPSYNESTNNMKLMSIEYLAARLMERRLRAHVPFSRNRGFQFAFSYLRSKDVRSLACDICEQSRMLYGGGS